MRESIISKKAFADLVSVFFHPKILVESPDRIAVQFGDSFFKLIVLFLYNKQTLCLSYIRYIPAFDRKHLCECSK